ncbi:uncharacterized protein LOC134248354 [Saccostrea cucullata]|uniref:uncharacterized protein LOC134248354 n=1 Tax=Saccostrea cuccullata TaxID=36930 RepID=UPI002ED03FA8
MREEELSKHIGECSKDLLFCNYCDFNSTTSKNLRRHLKRKHDIGEERGGKQDVVQKESSGEVLSESESWVGQDHGDLRGVFPEDISESESADETGADKEEKELLCSDDSRREEEATPSDPEKQQHEHKESQTEPVYFTESIKVITKWVEDGKQIKKIEKKKLL